jgi:hypothetical protein
LSRKQLRYRSIFLLLFLAVAVSGFSVPLEELIGAGLIEELASSNPFTQVQHQNISPLLMPRNNRLRSIINDVTETMEPTLLVESLYRYEKPAGAAAGGWTEAERTRLYNICLSISSLAGIEYFSASRNRMRVFYETSSVIDGPETKRPLRDPYFAIPPAQLSIYARQKDLTFGDNIYRYDYQANPESLIFVVENLTNLTVGPITVMRKNLLRSVVAVLDAGDSILVYMASMTKTVSFPGIAGRAGRSFSNRAEAILSWFARRADEAFL